MVEESMQYISAYDPEIAKVLSLELDRQRNNLELIASENLVSQEVMAVMGNVNYADFAISNQRFRGLHDEKRIVMYRGEEHALVTLEEYNLTGCAVTDASSGLPLLYNKADLHNPWFLVERSR